MLLLLRRRNIRFRQRLWLVDAFVHSAKVQRIRTQSEKYVLLYCSVIFIFCGKMFVSNQKKNCANYLHEKTHLAFARNKNNISRLIMYLNCMYFVVVDGKVKKNNNLNSNLMFLTNKGSRNPLLRISERRQTGSTKQKQTSISEAQHFTLG